MDIVTSQRRVALLGAIWLGLVCLGLANLLVYQSPPDASGAYSREWPTQTRLKRYPRRLTLIMFAHPKCPCTMASLSELARIMARSENRLTTYILFLKPSESGGEWDNSNAMQRANAIPGVHIIRDYSGAEAQMFGAVTSG